MSKRKLKFIIYIITLMAALIIGLFFSALFHLVLSQSFQSFTQITIGNIITMIGTDGRLKQMIIAFELIIFSVITIAFYVFKRESYESDMKELTAGIKTPVAVGQGQHGTARFLRIKEYDKAFQNHTLYRGNNTLNSLCKMGDKDYKEVERCK